MSDCRAKEPLSCRYHGQEKLVDAIFDNNQRMLGWKREEFVGEGEESIRQIVFEIAMMDEPRNDIKALLKTYKDRKLPGLAPYFVLGAAVEEIAYQYDPHKHEMPNDKNLLDIPADEYDTGKRLDHMYANFLVERGSYGEEDYSTSRGYLGRHFGMFRCNIAAVHGVNERSGGDHEGQVLIYGHVTCQCGRVKNGYYEASTTVRELLTYTFDHANAQKA